MEEGSFIRHDPCEGCGSSNGNAIYTDHTFCFVCKTWERVGGEVSDNEQSFTPRNPTKISFLGDVVALPARNIREDTCKHWQYRYGMHHGKHAQFAYYLDPTTREPVAAKVRFADKSFTWIGDPKKAPLYGQWLCRDGGKMLVVCEGEVDALSISQIQNLKWPVVSIENGASGAAKSIRKNLDFINKFETVVFMFDMDEPGRAAALECAKLLAPGKAKIASLNNAKDANELLTTGRGAEIIDAIWGASIYRPDGVVSIEEVKEAALRPVEWGLPWFLPTLTKATYGRRPSEIYCLGAGTGVGKTDIYTQQMAFDVTELNMKVGGIFLEQPVHETARRLAGKLAGKRFHVPDDGWTPEELGAALDRLDGKVYLYDHFGETEWGVVLERVRYMAVGLDIKLIYIDHLTAMADASNERESLEQLMKELAGLAQELGIIIHLISHLSTPEGKSHEEGGRVMIKHFKGARAIGFWSYFMFGVERNQQDDNKEARKSSTLRILKDRYTGQASGVTVQLHYDGTTGLISEHSFINEELQDAPF